MDMASSHYCKEVIEWLESMNIQLIAKKDNASKVCSARPIEKFWALCKAKYKKKKKENKFN